MRIVPVALLLLAGCLSPGPEGTILVDDEGTRVDVGDLDRVVVTSTDVAEIFVALGHAHRLAAIPAWVESATSCVRAPPGLEGIARIGVPHTINAESVVALAPSLVIEKDHPLQGTPIAPRLRQAGLDVYVLENEETLANVHHTVAAVARILATVDPSVIQKAQDLSRSFNETLERARTAVASSQAPVPRALFQLPAGLVAGHGTTGHLLLELSGARDLAAAAGLSGYRVMSPEALAQADPERVVVSCTAATTPQALFSSPKYSATTAARLAPQSMRVVDPAVAALVGPRFAQAVLETSQWLHPAAFDLIEPRVEHVLEGRYLRMDASGSRAAEGDVMYGFDPGDGSDRASVAGPVFHHNYTRGGSYTARLYLFDASGRIHEEPQTLQVKA